MKYIFITDDAKRLSKSEKKNRIDELEERIAQLEAKRTRKSTEKALLTRYKNEKSKLEKSLSRAKPSTKSLLQEKRSSRKSIDIHEAQRIWNLLSQKQREDFFTYLKSYELYHDIVIEMENLHGIKQNLAIYNYNSEFSIAFINKLPSFMEKLENEKKPPKKIKQSKQIPLVFGRFELTPEQYKLFEQIDELRKDLDVKYASFQLDLELLLKHYPLEKERTKALTEWKEKLKEEKAQKKRIEQKNKRLEKTMKKKKSELTITDLMNEISSIEVFIKDRCNMVREHFEEGKRHNLAIILVDIWDYVDRLNNICAIEDYNLINKEQDYRNYIEFKTKIQNPSFILRDYAEELCVYLIQYNAIPLDLTSASTLTSLLLLFPQISDKLCNIIWDKISENEKFLWLICAGEDQKNADNLKKYYFHRLHHTVEYAVQLNFLFFNIQNLIYRKDVKLDMRLFLPLRVGLTEIYDYNNFIFKVFKSINEFSNNDEYWKYIYGFKNMNDYSSDLKPEIKELMNARKYKVCFNIKWDLANYQIADIKKDMDKILIMLTDTYLYLFSTKINEFSLHVDKEGEVYILWRRKEPNLKLIYEDSLFQQIMKRSK